MPANMSSKDVPSSSNSNNNANLESSQRTFQWNVNAPAFQPECIDGANENYDDGDDSDDEFVVRDVLPLISQDLQDAKDYAYHRLVEMERHDFSDHYHGLTVREQNDNFKQALLGGYTHQNAIDFIAMSRVWMHKPYPTRVFPAAPKNVKAVHQFINVYGVYALYRVLAQKENTYILLACHMNVHGLHRGDLRFIEVNHRTKTDGSEYSCIGHLFPGDYIAVTELARLHKLPLKLKDVMSNVVTQESQCVWMAKSIALMKRKKFSNVPFAFIEDGTAVSPDFQKSVAVKPIPGFNPLNAMNKIFIGKGFNPQLITAEFAGEVPLAVWKRLRQLTATITRYPVALPYVTAYVFDSELTRQFSLGTTAYNTKCEDPDEILEMCALMGQSAIQVMISSGYDSRVFMMIGPKREGNLVRFAIPRSEELRTESLWKGKTKIVIGCSKRDANATIETVVIDGDKLNITARLSDLSRDFQFVDPVHMVHQVEIREKRPLEKGFLKNIPEGSNGKKAIKALYGGDSLDKPLEVPIGEFHYYGDESFKLNEFQCEYITRLLSGTPLTIANAPFGCGKSVTIAVGAVYSLMRTRSNGEYGQQLMITQSNYASVNLVDIVRKFRFTDYVPRIIRFVTRANWNELPDSSKSILDLPKQMADLFSDYVKDITYWNDDEELIQMAQYLMDNSIITFEQMSERVKKIYTKSLLDEKYTNPKMIQLFFSMVLPEVIIATADTLPHLLPLLGKVNTVQFDEASQVPETTLISLLSWVPEACFGLVGDIRQLPPYCTEILSGLLKDYGLGNTMDRAVKMKLFPQATLKYVYRCHPKNTELLGSLFYQRELISGVKEEDRNEFITRVPSLWSNPKFPIMLVNNNDGPQNMGHSLANSTEARIVIELVSKMMVGENGYFMSPINIGIISFYKAQESMFTEHFRGTGIKVGTVDSFQGSEREVVIVCCTAKVVTRFLGIRNRINVALSRAKQATIIVGSKDGLLAADYWKDIVEACVAHGCVM